MNAPVPYHHPQPVVKFAEMQKMAEAVAKSGLFGMKDTAQALALMLTAQAEGLHPATITQDYDIISGRAARKTHSVLARFQQAGGTVEWHELTTTKADATFSHPAGGSVRIDWTLEMAEKVTNWNNKKEKYEPLTAKDNWRNYPRAMLRARCIAEGIRAVFPAAIGGALVSEEAQDLDAIPGEVTARSVTVQKPRAKPRVETPALDKPKGEAKPEQKKEAPKVPEGTVSDGQQRILKARIEGAQITDEQFKAKFGVALAELPAARFNDCAAWVREMVEAKPPQ